MTLKPCPFCGGEAELFTDETGLIEICVECKQCHARTDWSLDWNARVIPEGYVKVVRCGQCKWWRRCDCPKCRKSKSPIMACGNPDIIDISVRGEFDYCSAGEAKEDTNA